MVLQSNLHRRQPRGFTLLLALGVVAVVTMAVMLSFSVVGREADSQADTRRQKQAFFAAEAGLAEGREAVRIVMGASTKNQIPMTDFGLKVTGVPGLGSATRPWYELLPGSGTDKWNEYKLTSTSLDTSEVGAGVDYPEQKNVRYRVFVRDDDEDNDLLNDTNRQLWVIAVGEVTNANGRPTRSVVQALVRNATSESIFAPGCITKGCGPDMTYDNPTDQDPPSDDVRVIQ
ncbi:hypothetical protein [Corallococcus llansteffanensis]|uniref:Type 4 fimbrial biogenesis protein PilX N-terminal domain-containing protein n=1 Tax=Corallococcus llansteffanensis TaxID=2316731 RepID=A0A3A8Q9Z5_9BACT|nr:hypothetical protein [Corallococcus llansteffanensis]RKH65008.1 hypothetical protein D7V93_06610 [Corallococcus llansteffanensis]